MCSLILLLLFYHNSLNNAKMSLVPRGDRDEIADSVHHSYKCV